ncbi:MAG: hypothetical protein GF311_20805 [Candidatus Lokiarchaeota archaeon]|nr:hypothetical protein [Candidatus Lokiarchaeota archaeon]
MKKSGVFDEERHLYLRKGHSETFQHILIKTLAYIYFWEDSREIKIEPNYRFKGYKPDLLKLIPSDIPRRLKKEVGLWVECKDVNIKKLQKLARSLPNSRIYWFNLTSYFRILLNDKKILQKIKQYDNLHLIGIALQKSDYNFLARDLGRKNIEWGIEKNENTLSIYTKHWNKTIEFQRW